MDDWEVRTLLVIAGIIFYFIGREGKIIKYIDDLKRLEIEKKFWIESCSKARKEIEELNKLLGRPKGGV